MKDVRNESKVMVKVVDQSELLKRLGEEVSKLQPNSNAEIRDAFGYVNTPAGLFVLCTEGVGSNKPITETNAYDVEVYATHVKEDGSKSIPLLPIGIQHLKASDILGMPILKEVPLHKFIRKFGSRLEQNYREWESHFNKVGVA